MKRNRIIGVGVVGLLVAVSLVMAPVGTAVADNQLLFPGQQQMLFGKKISDWTAEWWQYILAMPSDPNPLMDPTGFYCSNVQRGPVWFLEGTTIGGTVTTRSCTIPADRAIFFPLVDYVDINTAAQPAKELRAEIDGCIDDAYNLSVTLDGVSIAAKDLAKGRVKSSVFSVVFPASGLPTIPPVPAGIYSPAVDDGYYVMLKPLSEGPHTLRITGASPGCSYTLTNFSAPGNSVDVTYNLTIAPVSLK
jgi:hypothetical protein